MLYNIIVAPIEMIVDWVFVFFCNKLSVLGIIGAVCGVSLVINFLALPLYNIADFLQEKERKIAKSLEYRTKRIKKAFKGDERFMMLSTFYRQNNYNPLYVLRSSLSILIEIPFFIAAYHYLSNCKELQGASFWIFSDLGSPDNLLKIGTISIHILPIIMTAINLISGAIYAKDAVLREKIQLYVVAFIFLALLYNSPSGLVIYWILNNLFSLAKNVVMKTKHPAKILHFAVSALLLVVALIFWLTRHNVKKIMIITVIVLFVTFFPLLKKAFLSLYCAITNPSRIKSERTDFESNKKSVFLLCLCCFGLALLCGLYLPANVIATSPIEFSFLGDIENPLAYIWNCFCTFLGVCVFWPLCVFKLFGDKIKRVMPGLFFTVFITALVNAVLFPLHVDSNITVTFAFSVDAINGSLPYFVFPIIIAIAIICIFLLCRSLKKLYILSIIVCAVCLAEFGIGLYKIINIQSVFSEYATNTKESRKASGDIKPLYHLSKTGQNVIVVFLDRAVNGFFPYALQDVPELQNQLKGFVWYPNTVSFSQSTLPSAPAMMGGYEYTPFKINEQSNRLLRDKHNEASMVMPKLFADAGFDVTVTDPPMPNYTWKGDLSVFNKNDGVNASELAGKYVFQFEQDIGYAASTETVKEVFKKINNFSVIQIIFPIARDSFNEYVNKKTSSEYEYLDYISCLYYLPNFTDFNDNGKNQFVFIGNDTTHSPTYLEKDFLTPSKKSNNNGSYKTEDENSMTHYNVFVAALKRLGIWFDYLRENSVYNNTRIIIVADHGAANIYLPEFTDFPSPWMNTTYTPLFLYKDFNSNSPIYQDNTFMTNADTLFIAKENLLVSDTNPYTNKTLTQDKSNGVDLTGIGKRNFNPLYIINKTQFILQDGIHVSDNIFNKENWIPFDVQEEKKGGAK